MVTDAGKGNEMADKKADDFWGKSDDDFWSKPVITEDWLNSGNIEKEEPKPQNPYGETENPHRSVPKEPVYGIPNQPAYTYRRNENAKVQGSGKAIDQEMGKKKNFPIFAWINLIFLALTMIVVSVSILATGQLQSNADYRNRQLDYERIATKEDSFPVYDNNIVTLAQDACIVFGQNTDKQLLGIPEGEMLIAVPIQVKSDEYKSGQYALRDIFIGCDLKEQRVFRSYVRDETIFATLAMLGFKREEMLSSYGMGNGRDENGFLFFFVPEKTREITFYAEERKTEKKLSILVRRYEKNLIISERGDRDKWLKEVRESEGWQ